MSNTNGSTAAQRRYIAALAKNYTAAQVTKLIKATGTDSARALDERSTLNQRLTHLTKNYASKMITILKDEDKAAIIIQPFLTEHGAYIVTAVIEQVPAVFYDPAGANRLEVEVTHRFPSLVSSEHYYTSRLMLTATSLPFE